MPLNYIVEVYNVGMKYQSPNGEITALENINFSVREGEFVSIVGPSGCGKSTLFLTGNYLSERHVRSRNSKGSDT